MRHKTQKITRLIALIFLISSSAYSQTPTAHQTPPKAQVPQKISHRIVTLSPHLAEMVASAGALNQLVGVVSYSDYPKAVRQLPIVGDYNALNFEKILQLKPDIILVWQGGNRPQDLARLKQLQPQLGFKLFYSQPQKLNDIANEIDAIAQLVGTEQLAQAHTQALRQQLQQLKQNYQQNPKISPLKVFYEIWHQPLITINGQHFISQAIAICKGINIFADLKPIAGQVSLEVVIKRNPEVILLGGNQSKQQSWQQHWQNYPMIQAVKHQRLIPLNADLYQRPTARLIQNLPDLCQKIHAH